MARRPATDAHHTASSVWLLREAAAAHGIAYPTLMRWMRLGRAEGAEGPYADLARGLDAAPTAPARHRTGPYPSAPLDPPWRASYARWRADASRAAQAMSRATHAQRRLERAVWELLGAADAIAEAADA